MGMTCSLQLASDTDIERLLAHPERVPPYPGKEPIPRVREVHPKGVLGFLLRFTPIRITEALPEDDDARGSWPPSPHPDPDRFLDIDKAWHGLHLLLTGSAEEVAGPLGFILSGGEPLDDEGYARAFRAEDARRVASALDAVSADELRSRFDPERMRELAIYPDIVWEREAPPGDTPLEWLMGCFEDVRALLRRAAETGEGLIIEIS